MLSHRTSLLVAWRSIRGSASSSAFRRLATETSQGSDPAETKSEDVADSAEMKVENFPDPDTVKLEDLTETAETKVEGLSETAEMKVEDLTKTGEMKVDDFTEAAEMKLDDFSEPAGMKADDFTMTDVKKPVERNFRGGQRGEFRGQRGGPRGESRGQMGEFRGQRGEFRGQRGEFRGQTGEFRGQTGEFRSQRGEYRGSWGDQTGGAAYDPAIVPKTPEEYCDAILHNVYVGRFIAARNLYKDLTALGHRPPRRLIGSMLVNAAKSREAQQVNWLLKEIYNEGHVVGSHEYNRIIAMYSNLQDPVNALMMFKEAKLRQCLVEDVVLELLMQCLLKYKSSAQTGLDILKAEKEAGRAIGSKIGFRAIKLARLTGDIAFADELYQGIELKNALVKSELLLLKVEKGSEDVAKQALEEFDHDEEVMRMVAPEIAIFYAKQGDTEKAMELLGKGMETKLKYSVLHQLRLLPQAKELIATYMDSVIKSNPEGEMSTVALQVLISFYVDCEDLPMAKKYAQMAIGKAKKEDRNRAEGNSLNRLLHSKYVFFCKRMGEPQEAAMFQVL